MAVANLAALSGLLVRLAKSSTGKAPRDVDVTLGGSYGSARADLYAPRAPARATVIAIHGVTVHGGSDARLVHFGKRLAESRVRCYVPTLAGLSSCQWTTDDIAALTALVSHVRQAHGQRPMLVGFSNGASYALVAAAQPEVAADVRFVLGFGGYHSLAELLSELAAKDEREPAGPADVDEYLYATIVLGRIVAEVAALPTELRQEIDVMLDRYCFEATDEEKRALFETKLRGRGLARIALEHADPAILSALSPADQLGRIACPVSLVHDARDTFVPAAHAERNFAELRATPLADRHRLLVTPLLSHVAFADAFRWGELSRLARVLEPVLHGDEP
jgi:pimeloyl-ACP methyl ester carboxylesterase